MTRLGVSGEVPLNPMDIAMLRFIGPALLLLPITSFVWPYSTFAPGPMTLAPLVFQKFECHTPMLWPISWRKVPIAVFRNQVLVPLTLPRPPNVPGPPL